MAKTKDPSPFVIRTIRISRDVEMIIKDKAREIDPSVENISSAIRSIVLEWRTLKNDQIVTIPIKGKLNQEWRDDNNNRKISK